MSQAIKQLLGDSWYPMLREEFTSYYMKNLSLNVRKDRERNLIRPDSDNVFRAFRATPYGNVKVVILGQDPYPSDHADGLAFSSRKDKVPASLRNIFKEIDDDLDITSYSDNPDLTRWADQGVFLINTRLTVREGAPKSHDGWGWEQFTCRVIEELNRSPAPIVFMLWGNEAKTYKQYIDAASPTPWDDDGHHPVLEAYHPSPLSASRGFFGCEHFSTANALLDDIYNTTIDWR